MKVRMRYEHWYPRLFKIGAVVLYPYVLFHESSKKVSKRTVRHEMEHVAQIKEHGFFSFYLSYVLYMFAGFVRWWSIEMAYRKNPYEVRAYEVERLPLTNRQAKHMNDQDRLEWIG